MKNKRKLLLFSLLALAMATLFAGCGTKTTEAQITAIDGTTLTVSLGEMATPSDEDAPQPSEKKGEAPAVPKENESTDQDGSGDDTATDSGDTAISNDSGDTTTSTDSNQTPPEQPSGSSSDSNGTPPQGGAGDTPPNMGDGETPADMAGGHGFFTANGETMTFDISKVTVTLSDGSAGTIDDLAVNDIISITYTGDNKVSAITVEMSMPSFPPVQNSQ